MADGVSASAIGDSSILGGTHSSKRGAHASLGTIYEEKPCPSYVRNLCNPQFQEVMSPKMWIANKVRQCGGSFERLDDINDSALEYLRCPYSCHRLSLNCLLSRT